MLEQGALQLDAIKHRLKTLEANVRRSKDEYSKVFDAHEREDRDAFANMEHELQEHEKADHAKFTLIHDMFEAHLAEEEVKDTDLQNDHQRSIARAEALEKLSAVVVLENVAVQETHGLDLAHMKKRKVTIMLNEVVVDDRKRARTTYIDLKRISINALGNRSLMVILEVGEFELRITNIANRSSWRRLQEFITLFDLTKNPDLKF